MKNFVFLLVLMSVFAGNTYAQRMKFSCSGKDVSPVFIRDLKSMTVDVDLSTKILSISYDANLELSKGVLDEYNDFEIEGEDDLEEYNEMTALLQRFNKMDHRQAESFSSLQADSYTYLTSTGELNFTIESSTDEIKSLEFFIQDLNYDVNSYTFGDIFINFSDEDKADLSFEDVKCIVTK